MRTWMARLALSILGLTAVWPVMAQETTATITGVVTDDTGGALPGVSVTVKETRYGARVRVRDDRDRELHRDAAARRRLRGHVQPFRLSSRRR